MSVSFSFAEWAVSLSIQVSIPGPMMEVRPIPFVERTFLVPVDRTEMSDLNIGAFNVLNGKIEELSDGSFRYSMDYFIARLLRIGEGDFDVESEVLIGNKLEIDCGDAVTKANSPAAITRNGITAKVFESFDCKTRSMKLFFDSNQNNELDSSDSLILAVKTVLDF